MIVPEFQGSCQTTVGDTIVTIESHCPDDCKESILDALARLMKRDVAGVVADEE